VKRIVSQLILWILNVILAAHMIHQGFLGPTRFEIQQTKKLLAVLSFTPTPSEFTMLVKTLMRPTSC
jgi:hypothetical protein